MNIWAFVVVLLIALLWRRWGRGPHDGGDPARRTLGERFARGEINADEYRERLAQAALGHTGERGAAKSFSALIGSPAA